jgi:hypothetical protein
MHQRFAFILFLYFIAMSTHGLAQGGTERPDSTDNSSELLGLLDDEGGHAASASQRDYVSSTFKATRIINGHSVENDGKGVLDFRISHRFGAINAGVKNFFGLDNAVTKLGFDYGVTNWLSVGLGRGTWEKEYDGFIKVRLYRQTIDNRHPVSLSFVSAMSVQSMEAPELPAGQEYYFSNRLFYTQQLLIAHKFSKRFSLQLMPTLVHYNLVNTSSEPNKTVAIGVGGRMKLSNRIAFTGEYYYRLPGAMLDGYHNSLSLGFDIETGGHVFQLFFTNASSITERNFIGQTKDTWGFSKSDGIHFGFNISRVFTIVRPKEFKGSANKIW